MEIREHWEEFIGKYPGLKHDGGVPPPYYIAQEAHAAGWTAGAASERRTSRELETMLSDFCGETGQSESVADTLRRVLHELQERRRADA